MAAADSREDTLSTSKVEVIVCEGEDLPPVLCLTCLAYMNPHVEIVDLKTGAWLCPLCGQENVAPADCLGEGMLLHKALNSPIVEYHQQLPSSVIDVNEDEDAEEDTCTYILVVDANLPKADAAGIATAMEEVMKKDRKDNDENDMPKMCVGLIVFDHNVAMYQLDLSGVASADVYTSLEDEDEKALAARGAVMEERAYLHSVNTPDDLASLRQCLSAVFGVSVETDDPDQPIGRQEMLRRQKEARIRKEQDEQKNGGTASSSSSPSTIPAESPWVKRRNENKTLHPRRCTGEAIQCAIDMTSLLPTRTSRILLFTNGCPNAGDGSVVVVADKDDAPQKKHTPDVIDAGLLSKAVEYFDMAANLALDSGVCIDVFCTGTLKYCYSQGSLQVHPRMRTVY
jgi:hypothetical protein